tara:strand:- start:1211 stop:1888 length:678 start_codon:yes stop_codon:yes gene_type:complete
MYFGPEVDVAIIKYNEEEDPAVKSVIYQREIRAAMEKLVENIIHTFKFYYTDNVPLDQVQHEVVSFLVERLHKFDHTKGSKAFSYFSIVAKNFCILKNRKNYKKLIEHKRIDADLTTDIVAPENEDKIDLNRFMEMYLLYWEDRVALYYKKEREQRLAEAVLELFRKRDRIDIFNKKALYVYIREMTNANTQQITKVVKDMKVIYKKMFSHYLDKGFIDKDKIYR